MVVRQATARSRTLFRHVAWFGILAIAATAYAAAKPKPKAKTGKETPTAKATEEATVKPVDIFAKPAESLAGELVRQRPEKDRKLEHDLLNSLDLTKDVVYTTGESPIPVAEQFQFVDGVLRTPEKGDARLCFPADVPKFYRLSIDAFLKPGAEDPQIGVGAAVDGHQFFAEMRRQKVLVSQFYGRELIGRFIGRFSQQGDPELHDGVELYVGPWGVMLRRQSGYFEWAATGTSWSLEDRWRVPSSDQIFVCFPSGQYDVHSVTLEPLTEESWIENVTRFVPEGVLAWGGKFRDQAQVAPTVEPLPSASELRGIILLQARRGDFDSLEAWADRFRKADTMAGQEHALELLYDRVGDAYLVGTSGSHGGLEAWFQGQFGFIDAWLKQNPKSVTARIAQAQAYIAYAWDARGSEFADKVPEDAWKLFGERMETAHDILDETARLKPRDVCVFTTMLGQGKSLDWDKEKMRLTAQRALQISKKDYKIIDMMTVSLLPRWGGEPGDLGKLALWFSDQIKGPDGLSAYMRVVRGAHTEEITLKRHLKSASPESYRDFTDPAVVLEEYSAPKLKAALPVVLKRRSKNSISMNHACWIYCVLENRKGAKEMFENLGGKPELSVWETQENFDHWRKWAGAGE